jgi:DNA-binding SARP family transcriptional activator
MSIALLGSFTLARDGIEVQTLTSGSQKLLAYLALHRRSHARSHIAATLWPDASDEHSAESLRSALARLEVPRDELILADASGLRLIDSVKVDFTRAGAIAAHLLSPEPKTPTQELSPETVALFAEDLLPDWLDEWVTAETDDWRQLRMSALEALAARLVEANRLREAGVAARAAIRVDPLRESAQQALVKIYLAKGNQSDAMRAVAQYSRLLKEELGISPTADLLSLVSGLQHA